MYLLKSKGNFQENSLILYFRDQHFKKLDAFIRGSNQPNVPLVVTGNNFQKIKISNTKY